jgi:hypothetical protein
MVTILMFFYEKQYLKIIVANLSNWVMLVGFRVGGITIV